MKNITDIEVAEDVAKQILADMKAVLRSRRKEDVEALIMLWLDDLMRLRNSRPLTEGTMFECTHHATTILMAVEILRSPE